MSTTTCPNCGKPIRPGARFCGNCGHTISPASAAPAGATPASPATINCPQCGKPVRVGAKFCSNCGKVLQPEPAQPPAPATEKPVIEAPLQSAAQAQPAAQPQPTPAVTARPPLPAAAPRVPPGAPVAAPAPTVAGKGKRVVWPLVVIAALVVCILAVGGAYVYFRHPFGLLAAASPSATAPAPSQTVIVVISATSTQIPLPPQGSATPAFTEVAPLPTATVEALIPAATAELTQTVGLTATMPVTLPASSPAPGVTVPILLDDYFNDPLNVNWKAWGNPRPIIRSGPGDNWLELTATDRPETAGVTSRLDYASAPGNQIQFEGQLNPNYANFPLFFDWDPVQFDRGPENTSPTILHMAIYNNRIVLQAPAANNNCQKGFEGAKQHSYLLKFVGEKKVALYIDGSASAICELDIGIKPIPGKISFTGTGWVTHIIVTGVRLP